MQYIDFESKRRQELFIPWSKVEVKDYRHYFSIYNRDEAEVNFRVVINEFESGILWSVIKTILKENESLR